MRVAVLLAIGALAAMLAPTAASAEITSVVEAQGVGKTLAPTTWSVSVDLAPATGRVASIMTLETLAPASFPAALAQPAGKTLVVVS